MAIHPRRRARREEGRIVAMVPVITTAVLICVGIGVDFSGQALAEQDLRDQAAYCARSGAVTGQVGVDPAGEAVQAATTCLAELGVDGTALLEDTRLIVEVHGTYTTRLLGLIAIDHLAATGRASTSLIQER
jgi:hypothetical protein